MKNAIRSLLLALPLLGLAATAHGSQAGLPAVYEGKVNHVGGDTVLRMTYRGGQIRVKPRNLDTAAVLDDLMGRHVRVVEPHWRDGYLEGHLEVADNARGDRDAVH